jgi:hypothetical protein
MSEYNASAATNQKNTSNSKYGYKIQTRLDDIRTLVLLNVKHADYAHPTPIPPSPFSVGRIFNEP